MTADNIPSLITKMAELRHRVNEIDDRVQDLLEDRARLAVEIGFLKQAGRLPIIDRSRESQVIGRLVARSEGRIMAGESVREIFTAVIKACRAIQAPLKIFFPGPFGGFGHSAAIGCFGAQAEYYPNEDLRSIFDAVESGQGSLGLAPIENNTEGLVGQTFDLLLKSPLKVSGIHVARPTLALMSSGRDLSRIKKVAAPPQALAQCRQWLGLNMPGVEVLPAGSTGAAATLAMGDPNLAIVGHGALAAFHGLMALVDGIENKASSHTTFFIVGPEPGRPTGHDRSLVWFETGRTPGSLHAALGPLAEAGITLIRLHSRVIAERASGHRFFLEMEGHFQDEKVARALAAMRSFVTEQGVMGAYEAATP